MPQRYLLTPEGVNILLPPMLHLPTVQNPAMLQQFGKDNLREIITAWETEVHRLEGMLQTDGSRQALNIVEGFIAALQVLVTDRHTPTTPRFPIFRQAHHFVTGQPIVCFRTCESDHTWPWQRCPDHFRKGFTVAVTKGIQPGCVIVSFDKTVSEQFRRHVGTTPRGSGAWYTEFDPRIMRVDEFEHLVKDARFRDLWLHSVGSTYFDGNHHILQDIDHCFEQHTQKTARVK